MMAMTVARSRRVSSPRSYRRATRAAVVVPAAVEVVLHHTCLLAFRTPPFFVPVELGTPVAVASCFHF